MSFSYILDQQIPREYWFCVISHSLYMLNVFPGKLYHKLKPPHELVYDKRPDKRTCFLLFSVGYFCYQKYGASIRSSTQSQTIISISIGMDNKSNQMMFYNPVTHRIYTTGDYALDPGLHNNYHFGLTYYRGIFIGT